MLRAKYSEYRDARNDVEDEIWIEDLRAFMGQYDPDILAKIKKGERSQVYVGLTRTKVLAAYSRITDLLFQRGQKFFSIESTPITKQPILENELTEQSSVRDNAGSRVVDPNLVDDLISARFLELKDDLEKETEMRVENMSEAILDQSIEANLEGKI